MRFWTYRRPFKVDGQLALVTIASYSDRTESRLFLDGVQVAADRTPVLGPEATRNHILTTSMPDGRRLAVEAGHISMINVGIIARLDGELLHESHPGRRIAYPEKIRAMAEAQKEANVFGPIVDEWRKTKNAYRRNGPSIATDIASGLVFFAVAKMYGLTAAAVVGAVVGIALVVLQRFIRTDILGGLALFGIAMMLISAGYALVFQDETAIQLRPTIMGLLAGALFLVDSMSGGRYLARGMMRYVAVEGIDPVRLARAGAAVSIISASTNYAVLSLASEDTWLFYNSFGDIALVMVLFGLAIRYATAAPVSKP